MLNKGIYYADIYITNPMIEGYVDFHKCLMIEVEGTPLGSGHVMDYSNNKGWIFLE